jgi:hypothetical protein
MRHPSQGVPLAVVGQAVSPVSPACGRFFSQHLSERFALAPFFLADSGAPSEFIPSAVEFDG